MKKILTFALLAATVTVLLSGCYKNDTYYNNKSDVERARVIDYENGTPYSIIRYDYDGTYAIIESTDANTNLWPEIGDRLEGVFKEGQERSIYNITGGFYARVYVLENVPTKNEAYKALYYYNDRYLTSKAVNKSVLMSEKRRLK